MNTRTIKQLNKFVVSFFETNDSTTLTDKWLKNTTQQKIKSILTKNTLKDPNAPKRGKSAYLFFCDMNRESVKVDLGNGVKATDVTRELGVRWNSLKKDKSRVKELKKLENE